MNSSRVTSNILGYVFALAMANVSAAQPPSLPDLQVDEIRLGIDGKITVQISNQGTAVFPGGGGKLSIFVDHWRAVFRQRNPAATRRHRQVPTGLALGVIRSCGRRAAREPYDGTHVHVQRSGT